MKVRVEFDPTPIRHIAIQCPKCERWFYGWDVTTDNLCYEYEIKYAHCTCPVCGNTFSWYDEDEVEVETVDSAEACYDGCLEKKVVWE